MKPAMFSEGITFYAPPALVEQARKKATDEGRTMSELMRAALRREVLSNAA